MSMPGQVSYQVTAVVPAIQYGTQGQQVAGKQLTIVTSTGYEGDVFVPNTVIDNVDQVKAIIDDEVKRVAAAQQITGTVSL